MPLNLDRKIVFSITSTIKISLITFTTPFLPKNKTS